MLNKRLSETKEFATEAVATVTVDAALLSTAANDGLNGSSGQKPKRARRIRRQPNSVMSHVGGWTVRMW